MRKENYEKEVNFIIIITSNPKTRKHSSRMRTAIDKLSGYNLFEKFSLCQFYYNTKVFLQ